MSSDKIQIPRVIMAEEKKGIMSLVGKKMTKKVKFMGEDVVITKLNVSEVLSIQEKAKELEKDDKGEDTKSGFAVLQTVITSAVEGGEELTEDDFNTFPMDELTKLSNEIMKFSGIGAEVGK